MVQPRHKQKARGPAASLPAAGSSHHAVRRPKLPQGRPKPGSMADPGQQPPAPGTWGGTQTDSTWAVTGEPWHTRPHCETKHTHRCALSHGALEQLIRKAQTAGHHWTRKTGKGKWGGKNTKFLSLEDRTEHITHKTQSSQLCKIGKFFF